MSTPERILDVAEAMFAEHGYHAVSLRSILRACDANIAAAHYHFGSKDALLKRIFEVRSAPIVEARARLLQACTQGKRAPMLEDVLEAYFRPALVTAGVDERARRFMRLRAAIAHERAELSQMLVATYFNAATEQFIAILATLLDHLSPEDIYWRFHFLLGSQYYTLANPGRIQALSRGACDPSDSERALHELVAFAAAALRAPAASRRRLGAKRTSQTNPSNRKLKSRS